MVLTRLEKIAFIALVSLLGLGLLLLVSKVGTIRQKNQQIMMQIDHVAALTDQTVLSKGDAPITYENASKLNLNRTDLKSIKSLPGMTPALSERVFAFIKERGEIKDLNELLGVKGMTKRRIRQLENYVTAIGGHSGQAAWGDKLNLNFATFDDINALPGVGKKMAEKIIEFRNSNGGFFSIEDLKEVPGLTEKTIAKFIDMVEVR